MWNIQEATYTVCFDNGVDVDYKCKAIMQTHELYGFEEINHDNGFDWVYQYVTLEDGTEHEVHSWEYMLDYCGDDDTSDWYWFK